MNGLVQKIWTYQLNGGSLTIDESFGLIKLSIVLVSGTGTVIGSESKGGYASIPIDLVVGIPVNVCSDNINPLDDYTITTTGVVAIIGK